ncbi:sulfotransferase family protein [Micromonospora sp. NPDC050397]|uniref:sulfotransferase family protein n=1 Tax=Micromonospora sp. NPDC050397 TaxID=3364279 RepID=UPI00384BBA38
MYRRLVSGDPFAAAERAAGRRTGLAPAGDEAYRADLRVLHRQLLAKPALSPLGGLAAQSEITRRMQTRLSVLHLLDGDPSIEAAPVRAPVFVTGLPRTATTLTHRLLAQATAVRAPMLWELLRPEAGARGKRQSLRAARWMSRMYHASVPATRDIHPSSATSVEECTFLLPQTLMYEMMGPIPAYRQWYTERDPSPDYRYLKQQLQVLQHGRPDRRWVLKSPFHLANLDPVFDTFPDATVVWTHRDPAVALASWCSLIEANMLMYNERVDRAEIGATWLPIWADATARATRVRQRFPDRFHDVAHASLSADPVGVTRELWRRLGIDADAASVDRLITEAGVDGRRVPGRHRYPLERYGLSRAEVEAAFRTSDSRRG